MALSEDQRARLMALAAEVQASEEQRAQTKAKAEPTPRRITFASDDLRPGEYIISIWGHSNGLTIFQSHARSPRTAARALTSIFQQSISRDCFGDDPARYTVPMLPGAVVHRMVIRKAAG
jgi:hypothetical protein